MALPPADALSALINGVGLVTAYFASPPYTELALRDGKVHAILNSADVFSGKASFFGDGRKRVLTLLRTRRCPT